MIACNILGGQHEVKPEAQLLQIAVNPNARLEAATWRKHSTKSFLFGMGAAAATSCPSRFNTIATFFPFGFTASVVSLCL
jgi:hypothetical protein